MGCQISPSQRILSASRCFMFNFSQLFVFLVCLTEKTRLNKTVDVHYQMHCDCGKRNLDQISEMDCEESARLEAQQQAEFDVSLNFPHIYNLIISI